RGRKWERGAVGCDGFGTFVLGAGGAGGGADDRNLRRRVPPLHGADRAHLAGDLLARRAPPLLYCACACGGNFFCADGAAAVSGLASSTPSFAFACNSAAISRAISAWILLLLSMLMWAMVQSSATLMLESLPWKPRSVVSGAPQPGDW